MKETIKSNCTSSTLLFYNEDFHKQKPVKYSDCINMSIDELYNIFSQKRYRRNTGTFLMTDSLAKNLDAHWIKPHMLDEEVVKNAKVIVTNAFHCISPRYIFPREYWENILSFGLKIVPMTCGFRYHENGEFNLSNDIIYILKAISERNEIGVRGEISAEILNKHGIKNVRIVGCHSLFYHMDRNFTINNTKKDLVTKINFNFNQCYSDFFQSHKEFCETSLPIFNYFYNLYKEKDMKIDYTLQTNFMKELIAYDNFSQYERIKDFPIHCGKYYFSVEDWVNGIKDNDFSIGTQFHGNVAAILAGIPALIIGIDNRMEELCKVHKIPFIRANEFDSSKNISYYYNLADYDEFNKEYSKLYDNFIEYCRKNDVLLKEI